MTKIAALDLGSGTIKFSAFEPKDGSWQALALEETNTELRRDMGPERLLQPGPIAETLEACQAYLGRARELGIQTLPAYATSALRKAANPEALLQPLKLRLGLDASVLSEEEEARMNFLGFLAGGKASGALVIDPGGDSTDCAWIGRGQGAKSGIDWRKAETLSLPFGSVSLLEKYGSSGRSASGGTEPIPKKRLELLIFETKAFLESWSAAKGLRRLKPVIRMNAPIARALGADFQRGQASLDTLRALTYLMAGMDHEERVRLIQGEPVGKVDRTPFGFASWIAILEFMGADNFSIEPYGIKLGAALALNHQVPALAEAARP